MSNESKIEWTERTWNITSGCTKVSQGCKNCYASRLVSTRLAHLPQNEGVAKDGNWTGLIKCHENKLNEPFRRKKPTTYFVCSQSDLFHDGVSFEFIDKAFAVMALCPQHTFIVLTKRPERMREYFEPDSDALWTRWLSYMDPNTQAIGLAAYGSKRWADIASLGWKPEYREFPLPNVWLGTSVEDQKSADERIPELLKCPAAHRFLSCEPLLGMVNIDEALDSERDNPCRCGNGECHECWSTPASPTIDLVIVGGESGPNARPMHPDWARSLRDQCKEAGVPFYFKQWGEWRPPLDGETYNTALGSGGNPPSFLVGQDGQYGCYLETSGLNPKPMIRVGKAKAGRLLDGALHDDLPWRMK